MVGKNCFMLRKPKKKFYAWWRELLDATYPKPQTLCDKVLASYMCGVVTIWLENVVLLLLNLVQPISHH